MTFPSCCKVLREISIVLLEVDVVNMALQAMRHKIVQAITPHASCINEQQTQHCHHSCPYLQVTRPTSAAAAASTSKASSPKDAKDKGGRSSESQEEGTGLEVPPVSTLLEFVAWVVLTGHPVGSKAVEDWSKGRGGYLMDELDQVKEAYIRVQVVCV